MNYIQAFIKLITFILPVRKKLFKKSQKRQSKRFKIKQDVDVKKKSKENHNSFFTRQVVQ